jgi:hypothetical protein
MIYKYKKALAQKEVLVGLGGLEVELVGLSGIA